MEGDSTDEGLHPGAQLAVFKNGELVIELAGGIMRPSGESVTFSTLFQIRSITKALAAMVMLVLHDRGRFSFNDPVTIYWKVNKSGTSLSTFSLAHKSSAVFTL